MLCTLVRWQLDGALDGAPLGRVAAAHLARCEGCQARAARLSALHGRLTAGARAAVPPPPVELPVVRAGGRRAAFALAAVGAVAAIALIARRGEEPSPAPGPAAAMDGADPDRVAGSSGPDERAEPSPSIEPTPSPSIERSTAPSLDPTPAPPDEAVAGVRIGASRDAMVAEIGGVLFRAPRPLRAELKALAADGKRGALAILDIGGVGSWSDRIR